MPANILPRPLAGLQRNACDLARSILPFIPMLILAVASVRAGQQPTGPGLSREGPVETPAQNSAEYVMQLLDNAIWIPDGKVASKQIYVIAAPWCPYCAELYRNTRLVANQVQLRWIESNSRDDYNADFIGEIANAPTPEILLAMYGPKRVAHRDAGPIGKRADAYNTAVATTLQSLNPSWSGGYPSLVWLDTAGTYHIQNRAHLAEAIKSVTARPWAASVHPIGFDMMKITRVPPKHADAAVYIARAAAHLYWDPSTKAPIVGDLKNDGKTYKIKSLVTINGNIWVEINTTFPSAGDYGWFLRAEDIKLVGAQSTRPAASTGGVDIGTESSQTIEPSASRDRPAVDSGIISAYAGTYGQAGHLGDLGPASKAQLSAPFALAFDQADNLYIGDNIYVRRVDHSSGVITTVAGAGNTWGDRGLATRAELWSPRGLAFDRVGNLYIADVTGQVIRKIDHVSGIITTVAGIPSTNCSSGFCYGNRGYSGDGGPAVNARLFQPKSLAFDAADNLYIADGGNNVIRKVTATTGIIETLAGVGPGVRPGCVTQIDAQGDGCPARDAVLNMLFAIACDADGNLYISHEGQAGPVIRKVDNKTGIITRIAGGGTGCVGQTDKAGDGCLASSTRLLSADAIVFDSSANLYIANLDGVHVISASTGVMTRVVGNGTGGHSGDGGPALSAQLGRVNALAFDSTGDLYVADSPVVRKVTKVNLPGLSTGIQPSKRSADVPIDRGSPPVQTSGSNATRAAVSAPPGTKGALQQAIAAKYPLGQPNADRSDLVASGAVLVLLKDDLGLSIAGQLGPGPDGKPLYAGEPTSTYKGGKFQRGGLSKVLVPSHNSVAGEKCSLIGVEIRNDGAVLEFLSDAVAGVRFKGFVKYPFAKGQMPAPEVVLEQIGETIKAELDVRAP